MSFGSYKSSGSISESVSGSFSSGSSFGSESLGSLSGSYSFSGSGSSNSGLSDSGSSDGLSSSGGSFNDGGGGDLGSSSSGSGSEGGIEYYVHGTVDVSYEPPPEPIAAPIMEANQSGFPVVKNDGDDEGGLFCDSGDLAGVHHSIITGSFTEPHDFLFTWNTNDSSMLWHLRTLKVTNMGWPDIDVNGNILHRFDTIYIVNTSESANWMTVTQALSVTRA